jgi:hypothetical protein
VHSIIVAGGQVVLAGQRERRGRICRVRDGTYFRGPPRSKASSPGEGFSLLILGKYMIS